MALPDNNISISMVRNELGESSNDLSVLCRSDNINKWSKWKPVNSNDTTMTSNRLAELKWGLEINTYDNPTAMYNGIMGINYKSYNYLKPTVCRLGDFRNYNQNAEMFAKSNIKLYETPITIKKGGTAPITVFEFSQIFNNSTQIGFEDLKIAVGVDELYRCVCLKIGNNIFWTSAQSPYINWLLNSTIKTYTGPAEIILCYTNYKAENEIRQGAVSINQVFIPIPTDEENINPYNIILSNESTGGEICYAIIKTSKDGLNVNYDITLSAKFENFTGGTIYNLFFNIYNEEPVDSQIIPIGTVKLSDSVTVDKINDIKYNGSINSIDGTTPTWYKLHAIGMQTYTDSI